MSVWVFKAGPKCRCRKKRLFNKRRNKKQTYILWREKLQHTKNTRKNWTEENEAAGQIRAEQNGGTDPEDWEQTPNTQGGQEEHIRAVLVWLCFSEVDTRTGNTPRPCVNFTKAECDSSALVILLRLSLMCFTCVQLSLPTWCVYAAVESSILLRKVPNWVKWPGKYCNWQPW